MDQEKTKFVIIYIPNEFWDNVKPEEAQVDPIMPFGIYEETIDTYTFNEIKSKIVGSEYFWSNGNDSSVDEDFLREIEQFYSKYYITNEENQDEQKEEQKEKEEADVWVLQ